MDAILLEPLKAIGCETTHDNMEVVRQAEVVILGVKPHIVPLVADGLKDRGSGQLLVSVAAGSYKMLRTNVSAVYIVHILWLRWYYINNRTAQQCLGLGPGIGPDSPRY